MGSKETKEEIIEELDKMGIVVEYVDEALIGLVAMGVIAVVVLGLGVGIAVLVFG